jgi:hypothetical protein
MPGFLRPMHKSGHHKVVVGPNIWVWQRKG